MAVTYGVTNLGFVRKPISAILAGLNSKFVAKFGSAFDVSPESPDGQVIGIVADEIDLCWSEAQAAFNGYRPGATEGVGLDAICELTGAKRYVNIPTRVTVDIQGPDGTIIPKGSIVGDGTYEFVTEDEVELPGDVTVACTTLGAIYVGPNTVTTLITTGLGWTSATNPEEGTTGIVYEQDPSLRARRDRTTVSKGTATVEAIYSSLADLDLDYIRIRDNDTGSPIGAQPSGTIFVVVDGGTRNDIARRIYSNKAGGVPTHGDITVSIKDSRGYSHDVNFSRSSRQQIYITGTFKRRAGSNLSSNDVITTLKEATMNYINSLSPGEPVVWSYLFQPLVTSTPGIEISTLFVGITASPTGTSTILLEIDKRAEAQVDNVIFTENI